MKTNSLLLTLAVLLAGCNVPTRNQLSPARPAPLAMAEEKEVKSAPLSSTSPEVKGLEIYPSFQRTTSTLTWPAGNGYFVLGSTNIAFPKALWQPLPNEIQCASNSVTGRYEAVVTNSGQVCLFTLAQKPTNRVCVAWNYDFNRSPEVTSFVLYYGTKSRAYTTKVVLGYRCLWATAPAVVGTNYYAVTAISTNGLESPAATEAVYVRKNP